MVDAVKISYSGISYLGEKMDKQGLIGRNDKWEFLRAVIEWHK